MSEAPSSTPARYELKLMFEWGGGCLWCVNEAALRAFDVGNIEDKLPLSDKTRARLEEMSTWHDSSLNWDDPAGPGPWTPGEHEDFERAAVEVLERVRAELGPEFQVGYRRL
ncbi:hypothetical protein [Longimicrobium sp.]|uniref:hypothetical protein n=1 Tax=Longimicrobium sp. TaxID=2029185 RepID=UPI002E37F0FA|nr:hypothetical protein [Longimicrobium sp.]HEX6040988.1 hypothetical protein [Longimicrobium sp.]